MGDSDYTLPELARELQRALVRMEALAGRLESGQFVSTEVFRTWRDGLDTRLKSQDSEIASLKDDRKWLVRALVLFIITTVLGVVFASAGGIPGQ